MIATRAREIAVTVGNTANGIDGDLNTFATMDAVVGNGSFYVVDQPVDDGYGANRSSTKAKFSAEFKTVDTNDRCFLYGRKVTSDAWTELAEYTPGTDLPPGGVTTLEVDATALFGTSDPTAGWQLGVLFFNGDGVASPTPPDIPDGQ